MPGLTPDPRGTRSAEANHGIAPDFAETRVAEVSPLTPEGQRRRRRFVRVMALAAILGGAALNFVPTAIPGGSVTEVRSGTTIVRTGTMSGSHVHGFPFTAGTARMGPMGELKSFTLDSTGLFGNFVVAAGVVFGLSFLFGRRRRDE